MSATAEPERTGVCRANSWRSEELWQEVLAELSIPRIAVNYKSLYDLATRVYIHADRAYKITLKVGPPVLHRKISQAKLEADMLMQCDAIPTVPALIRYAETSTACVITMSRVPGFSLESQMAQLTARQAVSVLSSLLVTVVALSLRGIAHNDILPRNVLLDDLGKVSLIDFDQAHYAGFTSALARNILGIRMQKPPVYGNWMSTALRTCARLVPWRSEMRGTLPADMTEVQRKLLAAWKTARRSNANAPGKYLAYYSLSVDGMELSGERPWDVRWQMLQNAVDFTGLRTLELGCNMGLLSCWLLKESGATSAVGVDADFLILNAAQQVADAYGVSTSFELVDLDSKESWENRFSADDFDVVFALNVLNWVRDKERLLRFLSRFSVAVFEGHDTDEIEIERFTSVGFSRHKVLGKSERQRTVFVFFK